MPRVKSKCLIDGCEQWCQGLGFCTKHYLRFKRHGNPLGGRHFRGEPLAFFLDAMNKTTNSCILWPFGKNPQGYGVFCWQGLPRPVHRMALIVSSGWNYENLHACHEPFCPNTSCMNPRHLRWDTQKGNAADRKICGTETTGSKHGQSKLTEQMVREIRASSKTSKQLAAIYPVKYRTIVKVRNSESWKHA